MNIFPGTRGITSQSKLLLTKAVVVAIVQLLSHIWLIVTSRTATSQASLSSTISQSLLKFMSIESVRLAKHLVLYHPHLLLPSISPSIRVFSNELALHSRQTKYSSFSISPSNEQSRLISFKRDWFYLLSVQGSLKNLLQHHNLKAFILWHSAFFMIQLSHLYMTTGKIIALTRTFVSKVTSCFFFKHYFGLLGFSW